MTIKNNVDILFTSCIFLKGIHGAILPRHSMGPQRRNNSNQRWIEVIMRNYKILTGATTPHEHNSILAGTPNLPPRTHMLRTVNKSEKAVDYLP